MANLNLGRSSAGSWERSRGSNASAVTAATRCHRHAVIDLGTNSVKLLVADVGQILKPVLKLSRQTLLGQGAFRTGLLQSVAIARTVNAVVQFTAKAEALRPASMRLLATGITREASNSHELVQAILRSTGLTVEILSGAQEADYMFQGVTSQPDIGVGAILVVDVGGGSTEWVFGNGGFTHFRHSMRLGTSRLLELFPPSDPPTRVDLARWRHLVTDFLWREVCPGLVPALAAFRHRPVCLVGLGGSLKSLALLASKGRAEDEPPALLRKEELRAQVEQLWRLSSLERRNLCRLNPEKAEIILAGAVIYEAIMSQLGFTEMIRSDQGVRSGVLLSLAAKVVRTDPSAWQPVPVDSCLEWGCKEPQTQLPTFMQLGQANASCCQNAIQISCKL